MSSRPLTSAAYPVPPATDPIGPATHRAQPDIAGTRLRSAAGAVASVKTERPRRPPGPHHTRLADVATARGFSAATVSRYFSTSSASPDEYRKTWVAEKPQASAISATLIL